MAIEFHCPRCQTEFHVADEDAGTKQRCPHCQAKVRVPTPEKLAPAPLLVSGAAIEFLCPRCQTAMQAPVESTGSKLRCPHCQAKVRVPEPVMAPAPGATIEFQCPRCDEVLRARGEHAGLKQFCPRCGGKVRVPTPRLPLPRLAADGHNDPVSHPQSPFPQSPVAQSPVAESPVAESPFAQSPVAESLVVEPLAALAAQSHADVPWTRPRRRQRNNVLGLMVPVVCVGLIAAVGAWLLQKPPVKLEGSLAGERVTDLELGPFRIDNDYLGRIKSEAQAIFERLEAEPIRASSQLLTLEFKGSTGGINTGGINLSLRSADGAEFYRVDPRPDKLLSKFLAEHQDEFKTAVQNELARSVPEFLAAVEKRGEEKQDIAGLAEFRDSVGLASLVTGFGYQVQAAIGKQAFSCVLEDRDGRLFFALPAGTEEFEIAGRETGGKSSRGAPRFPGRYSVQVSKKSATIHRESPDPKDKIRKLLEK